MSLLLVTLSTVFGLCVPPPGRLRLSVRGSNLEIWGPTTSGSVRPQADVRTSAKLLYWPLRRSVFAQHPDNGAERERVSSKVSSNRSTKFSPI
jgi:hypothetical protein